MIWDLLKSNRAKAILPPLTKWIYSPKFLEWVQLSVKLPYLETYWDVCISEQNRQDTTLKTRESTCTFSPHAAKFCFIMRTRNIHIYIYTETGIHHPHDKDQFLRQISSSWLLTAASRLLSAASLTFSPSIAHKWVTGRLLLLYFFFFCEQFPISTKTIMRTRIFCLLHGSRILMWHSAQNQNAIFRFTKVQVHAQSSQQKWPNVSRCSSWRKCLAHSVPMKVRALRKKPVVRLTQFYPDI